MAADGMICRDAIRSSGGGRGRRKRKNGVEDPTLADEEQLDEDISILEEGPDSPRPRVFRNESSRSPTVVPAAAPPARRGRTCQSLNCSNPTAQEDLTVVVCSFTGS
jgi:hypothetical protein